VARTAISFPVALHAQRAPDLCWMASLLMLESWFYTVLPNSHRPRAITVADHMGLRTIGNPPLAAADLAPFARYAGLEIVRKQATGAEAFSLLQTFGSPPARCSTGWRTPTRFTSRARPAPTSTSGSAAVRG